MVKLKRKFNLPLDDVDQEQDATGQGIGLGLDIDEINKLYTFGGEQGKKK